MSAATDIIFNDVIHQQRRIHVLSSTLFFYSALVALEGQRGGHLSLVAHWPCSVEHTVVTCPWPLLVSVSPCSLFPLFLSSSISLSIGLPPISLSLSPSLSGRERVVERCVPDTASPHSSSSSTIFCPMKRLYWPILNNSVRILLYSVSSWLCTIVYTTPEHHSFSRTWLLSEPPCCCLFFSSSFIVFSSIEDGMLCLRRSERESVSGSQEKGGLCPLLLSY